MQVDELAPGLWRWTAEHPEWQAGEGWEPEVACFYVETDDATLLIDPLVPAGDESGRFWTRLDEDVERRGVPVVVLLTGGWHRRSADEVAARYGASIHVAGEDELPGGVETKPTGAMGDVVLWIPALGALAVGDALISVDGELRLWGARDDPESVRALAELPVEHALVAHGDHVPGGRDALAAAVDRPPLD
jgi:glyoxylase-like metal-dependent hydrolase (beta-lactamase superfamily II)